MVVSELNSNPCGDELLSDEELLKLEKAIEQGEPLDASDPQFSQRQQHHLAYQFLDDLAAPVRSAIATVNRPPQLPDYEELTELARGGMGVVYRGKHKKTQRVDAIKIIRPDQLAGLPSETVSLMQFRFQQETMLAARVAHEHIVPVYQVGESNDCCWYSMQLVDGISLHELARTSTISPERIVKYMEQIARAVDIVHRHGILHGDIKPQNILIERETDRPLISDFGLAELDTLFSEQRSMGIAGTPAYMAPELAAAAIQSEKNDNVNVDRSVASDIYSLGATFWAALSASSPCYDNRTFKEQLVDAANRRLRFAQEDQSSLPRELMRIVQKCVAEDPVARYASAGAFADDLATWLGRPRWNGHFPALRNLLWMVVAPTLLLSGTLVWWLRSMNASEQWVWLIIFGGYAPLFATFFASQQISRATQQARRELWSIWVGHFASAVAVAISLRILCNPDVEQTYAIFYPCWAAISTLAFFAKSGNFWSVYRWIGMFWSLAAVLLAVAVSLAPVLFGIFGALTCILTSKGDRSFRDD